MPDVSHRPKLNQPFLLDDPERPVRRARIVRLVGTLAITLAILMGVGVAGYLAVIHWQRQRAYERIVRDDLTRMVEAQHGHRERTGGYGDLDDLGPAYVPSQAVWIDVQATASTWRAAARHERAPDQVCWVEGSVAGGGDVECG